MRTSFFILFILILIGLITLTDGPENVVKYVGTNVLTPIRDRFRQGSPKSDSTRIDFVGAPGASEAWPEDSTSYADALQSIIAKSIDQASRQPQGIDSMLIQKPETNHEFRDVLEEPYISESRRLHAQIQENYKKITGSQGANAGNSKSK